MANLLQWGATWNQESTVHTTGLSSLATGSATSISSVVLDNATNLDQYFCAEFITGDAIVPTVGGYVSLYAIPSADGTNYGNNYITGASETLPGNHLACIWPVTTSTAAAIRAVSSLFSLGPAKYAFIVFNNSGVALSTSENLVKVYSANDELQG